MRQHAEATLRSGRPSEIGFEVRKRKALRGGFAIVTGLMAFSAFYAYKVQESLSNETVEIHHRHVKQDDALWRLRRTLWLGGNVARDYLVHPAPETLARFQSELERLSGQSRELLSEIDHLESKAAGYPALRTSLDEFWKVVASVPTSAAHLDAAGRYAFIQSEVVPRRNVAGDLVRELAVLSQESLADGERAFAEMRRDFTQRLQLTLGLSLVLGIVVALLSLRHARALERKTARQYQEVEQARYELQQLSLRLMDVQEEERMRLSRELHDEVGQMVATVRLELGRAESRLPGGAEDVKENIARARNAAGQTMHLVRNLCLLLRPTALDDLGLSPALQWLVEDFTRRTGIRCVFKESDVSDDLPETVRTCMYRVIQESLHNCEKHAAASLVEVSVRQDENALELRIEDNGRGFRPGSPPERDRRPRFGLLGMRERALKLGGTLTVASEPGSGTRIHLRLPVTRTVQHPAPSIRAHA